MQKISILFLTNAYPDFDSSYRGIFVKKMASLLQRDGYKVSVVTPKIYKESPCFEQKNGIKVYRFPFFSGNRLLINYSKTPYLRMVLYCVTGFFFTIYASLANGCQLIHAHWAIPTGVIGAMVGVFLRKPLIITTHGSDFRLATDRSWLLRKVFLYVCKKARHIHSVSEVMKKGMMEMGIREEKISVFPMGVDETFFEVRRHRLPNLNKQAFTIVSNRNLLPIYNVCLLIRAIPMVLQNQAMAKFLIAGEGPERENLKREANRLNISEFVQFLGRIAHDEMPSLLARADIYVSTSLHDGTSVSLLEAMASGVFPIVTEIPANQEWIIDGQNGFLVPVDNEGILAGKIVEALRHPSLLKRACEKNRQIGERSAHWDYTIGRITKIYWDLFQPKLI